MLTESLQRPFEYACAVKWTQELPRESGIYLFMNYLDTLAEEISTLEVDLETGLVVPAYNLGTPPAPLREFQGNWMGPIPIA